MTVVTYDGHAITAKVLGSDPDTDLALLDVPGADLEFAAAATATRPTSARPWSRSRRTKGNLATGHGRRGGAQHPRDASNGATLAGLIQTGLTTTAETAGGALLDTSGQVVGILTTLPGVTNTGLAVPIPIAGDVQNQLDASGKVVHGWLGLGDDNTNDRAARTSPWSSRTARPRRPSSRPAT